MEAIAMAGKSIMDRFIQKNPLAVMTRCIAQSLMGAKLDEVFEQNRSQQYDDTIKFSTVAISMAERIMYFIFFRCIIFCSVFIGPARS